MTARVLALAVLLGAAACGSPGPDNHRSDWEIANAARLAKEADEGANALPPPPERASLLEFGVPRTDFRFFVDASSLNVSRDGIVRYVLVARSPSGVENVGYEALNCRAAERRLYATGRKDGTWERLASPWRPLAPANIAQRVLQREYLCPRGIAVASAQEGVDALRRGGHPLADAPDRAGGVR